MLGEKEYQITQEDYKKEKEIKEILKKQLENKSQVKESADSQEIVFTCQELFTNQYEKRLRELKKKL